MPFACGRRFLFLFALGMLWLLPAFWVHAFVWGMVAWDAVLLSAWWIDWRLLPQPHALTITRRWLEPAALLSASNVEIALCNGGGITLQCQVIDDLPRGLRWEAPTLALEVVRGREVRAQYGILPRERGDEKTGQAYIHYASRMQLAERWARADLQQTVCVYPSLEEVRRQTIYLARARQIELEKRRMRMRGLGREFESLREYQVGDDVRDVCWTASARRGKLVTRLYQIERSQPVWIVIDCGRLLRVRVGEVAKLDFAVSAAVSLAEVALYSGDRVGLLGYGRGVQARVAPGRGAGHLRTMLDALAGLHTEAAEADHLRAAAMLRTTQQRRSLVVWLTELADSPGTPDVVEAASQMLSRHLMLFAVISQSDVEQAAVQRPQTVPAMYEATAAQELLHRRSLMLARMRERGALTLEVLPQRLSTAAVNQYLHVKERNLL